MDARTVHDRRWWILGVLCSSLLVVVLDNTILSVALPRIAEDLKATQSQLEWSINSYTLVFAGLLFTYGVLGDRYGRRRILTLGMVLFGIGSLASAFAQTPEQLIAFRAFMGIGGAAVLPATLSIITVVFEPAERGRAIGIWAGFTGLAIAAGPITGGALLEKFWWGSVFLVNVPVVVVAVVAIGWLIPESKDPKPNKLDPYGVFLSMAAMVTLVYGIIKGGELNDFGDLRAWGPMLVGIILIVEFVLLERGSDHPSLDVTLFRNPAFSAANAAITLTFFALMGATFFLTFYLQFLRGYSPLEAGVRLLPLAVAIAFFAPRSSKLVHRIGTKATCGIGLSLVTLAFLGYQLIDASSSIWVLEGLLFLQGAGMGNTMAPATESIMSTLPRERAGTGSAVNNTTRQLGGALGVAILGSVLSASFRSGIEPKLAATPLPAALKEQMAGSVPTTYTVIARSGGRLAQLHTATDRVFVHALHVTALGSAAVSFAGLLVVLIWLPGRARAAQAGG
jgi:EmrB/QacA subfamily drug resistance transporter